MKIKKILDHIPFSADLYWWIRNTGKPPEGGYSLEKLEQILPDWVAQAKAAQLPATGKKVFIIDDNFSCSFSRR